MGHYRVGQQLWARMLVSQEKFNRLSVSTFGMHNMTWYSRWPISSRKGFVIRSSEVLSLPSDNKWVISFRSFWHTVSVSQNWTMAVKDSQDSLERANGKNVHNDVRFKFPYIRTRLAATAVKKVHFSGTRRHVQRAQSDAS